MGESGGSRGELLEARTSKCLFDINAFPRAGLHESAAAGARPLQTLAAGDAAFFLQVALVTRHDLDGGSGAAVFAPVGFHVDHVEEVGQRFVQGGRRGDVVDEEEGVGAEVR